MPPTAGPSECQEANFPQSAPGPRRQCLREGARKPALAEKQWESRHTHPPGHSILLSAFPHWLALPRAIPTAIQLSRGHHLLEQGEIDQYVTHFLRLHHCGASGTESLKLYWLFHRTSRPRTTASTHSALRELEKGGPSGQTSF